jgi:hypothetical protein
MKRRREIIAPASASPRDVNRVTMTVFYNKGLSKTGIEGQNAALEFRCAAGRSIGRRNWQPIWSARRDRRAPPTLYKSAQI